jgi:hypothetical protein
MADVTNVLEIVLIQCDLWIITVDIIQPYLVVVNYIARLLVAYLTDTAIDCHALIYVRLPGSEPWPALIELFLIQTHHILPCDPSAHSSGVCYTGI